MEDERPQEQQKPPENPSNRLRARPLWLGADDEEEEQDTPDPDAKNWERYSG